MKEYKICNRCVMDNSSDTKIVFDVNGCCNYCTSALEEINTTTYFPNEVGGKKLEEKLKEIKNNGVGKEYDCIMGISGGLDSSYLAYLGCKWGLRILAVHIDDGFDTEISKNNIEKLVNTCGINLIVVKPDPVQYYDLTKAYLKAGVPNIAVPQDNILFAYLYELVKKYKLKYFLSGGNFALESILQQDHVYNAYDVVNIKDIHKKFGTQPINKLKFISSYKKYLDMKLFGIETPRLLNFIDYNRERAFKELKEFCGFEYYGGKHLENIFTAFAQLYWFPKKFGVDKRRSHLSSMIVSGQIGRDTALEELERPMYDELVMREYFEIIKEKLGLTDCEFEHILNSSPHNHSDYAVDRLGMWIRKIFFR